MIVSEIYMKSSHSSQDKAALIQRRISYAIRIGLVLAIIFELFSHEWLNLFLVVLTLFLTFVPAILAHNFRVTLPIELELAAILFVVGAIYLGEIQAYYTLFWWWDLVLHAGSGILLGFIGFLTVYILNSSGNLHIRMDALFVAIFSFTFAVSIGVFWELFEFGMDSIFGTNMLKSGLVDTMGDLIVDISGALIVSLGSYYYLTDNRAGIFHRIVTRLISKNPTLFNKNT